MTEGRQLSEFEEFLQWAKQFDFVVIGGMAVGAYADQIGEPWVSNDLDVLSTDAELRRIASAAERDERAVVVKRPQPRNLEVLVLRWRDELEIDVLLGSQGLPDYAAARKYAWKINGVQIADPVHLLGNKLRVGREKDRPHIDLLRRVCFLFALAALKKGNGRHAFRLLQRWIAVDGQASPTPEQLTHILATAGHTSAQARRFLATLAVDEEQLQDLAAAALDEQEADTLLAIGKASLCK